VLASLTQKRLIVAGGIRSREEVDQLDALGIDAVVGMAIYTGAMQG
jgi:phosphoribosylformimino-5-aminoimidazole carboxamide ribotide isomerase